jgi:hypothetical protein
LSSTFPECRDEQQGDTDVYGNVGHVEGRKETEVDEIDHSPVEQARTSEYPIRKIADCASEDETKRDCLQSFAGIAKHIDDQPNDTECDNRKNLAATAEEREGCARVEDKPELEEAVDHNDRTVTKCCRCPQLRELVEANDDCCYRNGKCPIAQMRLAASTVVVA